MHRRPKLRHVLVSLTTCVAALLSPFVCGALGAQPPSGAVSPADSTLVGRILLAEDARDSTGEALRDGLAHADARIRWMAARARARIADPAFAKRDSLPDAPVVEASPVYAEPAWRLRYRGLTAERNNCGQLQSALGDSAWPVRLRAADLVSTSCADNAELVATLTRMVNGLPADASRRLRGQASWHGAAHAVVALARIKPAVAAPLVITLSQHAQPEVREYAVRAAAVLKDSMRLVALAQDANPNVQASAIDALRLLTGHQHDTLFARALDRGAPQVVRSAALALVGSNTANVRALADSMYARWLNYGNASFRDVRHALLRAAGRDTASDRGVPTRVVLPPRAVSMALGERVLVRVTMAPESGGGEFVVRMRGDVAPLMAAHLVSLVEQRYYDGLTWHRVEYDFVVQGGSPGANEYVGLYHFLRDALGRASHVRGTLGMSTRGHDTGDAQWFINVRNNARLDRDYTVFGEITEGIDVVDGILEGDRIASMRVIQ